MTDLESILARIESILKKGADVDEQAVMDLVQAYVEFVEPISAMLSRCASWAGRGLFAEAISVADDYPDLLRAGRSLVTDDLAQRVCERLQPFAPRGRMLPVIEPSWVQALDRAAAEIERTGRLLERHQTAALGRAKVSERIVHVRALIRGDPANTVWVGELARLEDSALEQHAAAMRAAFERGEAAAVLAAASEILKDQWTRPVSAELREEVRTLQSRMREREAFVRYAELESLIRDAASRADERALESLELEWVRVQQSSGVMPPQRSDTAIDGAFRWLAERSEARARRKKYDDEVSLLEQLLDARGSELDVSRQLGVVRTFDEDPPVGLVDRAQVYLQSFVMERRRRAAIRIAAVIAVVMGAGVLVWWRIQAADAARRASEVAAQVDRCLERHALDEAETLLRENAPLASEGALVAADAKVRAAKPAWQKDRETVAALRSELAAAAGAEVTPARKAGLDARWSAVSARATEAERADVAVLLAQVAGKADAFVERLSNEKDLAVKAWLKQTEELRSVETLPPDQAFAKSALAAYRERVKSLAGPGSELSQRFAELPTEQLAVLRAEIERLSGLETAITQRLRSVEEFRIALDKLLNSKDPKAFLEAYDALLSANASVLEGRQLTNAFRESRQRAALGMQVVEGWNALMDQAVSASLLRSGSLDSGEVKQAIATLEAYARQEPRWKGSLVVQQFVSIAKDAWREDASTGSRVATRLSASRIGELKVVLLANGCRFFRRVPDPDGPFAAGVVKSRTQVGAARLDGLDAPAGLKLAAAQPRERPPAVTLVASLAEALRKDGFLGTRKALLEGMSDLAMVTPGSVQDGGASFRLWVAMQLATIWEEEVLVRGLEEPLPADAAVQRVMREVRQKHAAAMADDWGAPILSPDDLKRANDADERAKAALPLFASLRAEIEADERAIAKRIGPFAGSPGGGPTKSRFRFGGVVAIDPDDDSFRESALEPARAYVVFVSGGAQQEQRLLEGIEGVKRFLRESRRGPTLLFVQEANSK